MEIGDLVLLPYKFRASIAIGEIKGPYEYRSDLDNIPMHTRKVKWINTDIQEQHLNKTFFIRWVHS